MLRRTQARTNRRVADGRRQGGHRRRSPFAKSDSRRQTRKFWSKRRPTLMPTRGRAISCVRRAIRANLAADPGDRATDTVSARRAAANAERFYSLQLMEQSICQPVCGGKLARAHRPRERTALPQPTWHHHSAADPKNAPSFGRQPGKVKPAKAPARRLAAERCAGRGSGRPSPRPANQAGAPPWRGMPGSRRQSRR